MVPQTFVSKDRQEGEAILGHPAIRPCQVAKDTSDIPTEINQSSLYRKTTQITQWMVSQIKLLLSKSLSAGVLCYAAEANWYNGETAEWALTLVPYHPFQSHVTQWVDHGIPKNRVLTGTRHRIRLSEPAIDKIHKCHESTSDRSHDDPETCVYPAFTWGEPLMKPHRIRLNHSVSHVNSLQLSYLSRFSMG